MDKKTSTKFPLSLPKILGYAAAGFVVLCIAMFAAGFCPPAGPWPMPPWCSADKAFVIPSGPVMSPVPSVAASTVPSASAPSAVASTKPASSTTPTVLVSSVFVPKSLDYLAERPSVTKNITYGVGMFDVWGSVCNPGEVFGYCDDSTQHIDDAFERSQSIGSGLILVTDFAQLEMNLSISFINPTSGAHTISQAELTHMASKAHATGQKLMLITNLYDAMLDSNLYNGELRARDGITYGNQSQAMLDTLFAGWETILKAQAQKAKAAGVDYFIINSRDIQFTYDATTDSMDRRFARLADVARDNYAGKVCAWGPPGYFAPQGSTAGKLDCMVFDWGVEWIFKDAQPSMAGLESAWSKYLSENGLATNAAKERYVLVMMPSYYGAYKTGWIEPVATYPEGKYVADWKTQAIAYEALFRAIQNSSTRVDGIISYGYWWTDAMPPKTFMRSDLSQSIRGKDAEQVFYEWATAKK